MSDASLLGAGSEPASVLADGVGSELVPAQVARELLARADEAGAVRAGPGPRVVETTTPTGGVHRSRAPQGPAPASPSRTVLDAALDRAAARLCA